MIRITIVLQVIVDQVGLSPKQTTFLHFLKISKKKNNSQNNPVG
jgi:hypothetical protein